MRRHCSPTYIIRSKSYAQRNDLIQMHTVRREVQGSRYRVLCHYIFNASALPEVWKYKDTTCQSVWESDGRELSEDLGEDGERTILIK